MIAANTETFRILSLHANAAPGRYQKWRSADVRRYSYVVCHDEKRRNRDPNRSQHPYLLSAS